jgi:hypothetical protein
MAKPCCWSLRLFAGSRIHQAKHCGSGGSRRGQWSRPCALWAMCVQGASVFRAQALQTLNALACALRSARPCPIHGLRSPSRRARTYFMRAALRLEYTVWSFGSASRATVYASTASPYLPALKNSFALPLTSPVTLHVPPIAYPFQTAAVKAPHRKSPSTSLEEVVFMHESLSRKEKQFFGLAPFFIPCLLVSMAAAGCSTLESVRREGGGVGHRGPGRSPITFLVLFCGRNGVRSF